MPDFLREANAIKEELIAMRRAIHRYPEIGKEEAETAKRVDAYLRALGIGTRRVADTCVIGLLEGGRPGTTVGLRADMDALAIEEYNDLPYASQRPGIMHACGHDCHTAALLGAAKLLAGMREQLTGNVKFFFQQDEEGDGGAQLMIDAGGLENPKVTAMFGAHVNPEIPAGSVGIMPGKAYAASNPFDVTIKGRSSHGAKPHEGVDAIAIAAQIVVTLQQYVSRLVNPVDSVVISIGMFNSKGGQRNVISDEVTMRGIIRTLGPEMRQKTKEAVRRIIAGIAEALGAKAEVTIYDSYPGVVNDPAMTELAGQAIAVLLGEEKLVKLHSPSLGTEDFGIFLEHVPGSFYQVGVYNPEKNAAAPLHSNYFCVDEDALPVMSAVHAQVAYDYLSGYQYEKGV
jgi:amidohydrolase